MSNPIVTVNVSQQIAPLPSQLQKTGAMLSQGGTILAVGSTTLLQQPSDLDTIVAAPLALQGLSWNSAYGGQVTATTTAAHGIPVGQKFQTTIKSCVPDAYNGQVWAIATGASAFTYYRATNPGVMVTAGTFTSAAAGELQAMVNTFFAQGYSQGVYVLELGAVSVSTAIANLQQFINSNDQMFYSYLVPRNWDGVADYLALLALFESNISKTYFFTTTTLSTYSLYTAAMKDVVALVEAPQYGAWARDAITSGATAGGVATVNTTVPHGVKPGDVFTLAGNTPAAYNGTFTAQPGTTASALVFALGGSPGAITALGYLQASVYTSTGIAAGEFTMAAAWWVTLNYSPSNTSRVPPYSYSFLLGVTMFPTPGNQVAMTALKAADINIVGFGAEGGISDTILLYGHTKDGRPFNYWYSVDWMQINIDRDIANAIINGSNTTVNPLYYNQDGINRLASVASQTGAHGISYGLALGRIVLLGLPQQQFNDNLNKGLYAGTLVVNADPFTSYLGANPANYRIGLYGGLTMVYTPLRGFEHIIFQIVVTDFVATA
jgi:hypothetical protein